MVGKKKIRSPKKPGTKSQKELHKAVSKVIYRRTGKFDDKNPFGRFDPKGPYKRYKRTDD